LGETTFNRNKVGKIGIDSSPLAESELLFVSRNTAIGVTHNRNEHVQEGNLGKEGGQEKEDPHKIALIGGRELVVAKFTQAK
jgi:hypothetical protein